MAYRPSKRSSRTIEPLEINIFPMMNLMVVLVPLLLSTATAIKMGVIELNLPQAHGGQTAANVLPKEAQRSLDLTVTITDAGFYVSSSQAVLRTDKGNGPTIEKLPDGKFDFAKLSETLLEVKKKIVDTPQDTKRIIIQAEPDIDYQTLVSTMDASRAVKVDANYFELFPKVSISAGVI